MFDVGPLRAISWTQPAFASSHRRNGDEVLSHPNHKPTRRIIRRRGEV